MPKPHPTPSNPTPDLVLTSLLEPFAQLAEGKRDLLREVLQIYVTKNAASRTELEKRQRLSALISSYAKGDED
ncbi:MAG: hypothetical protein WA830_23705 [Candidatus Sulfotelmatobacter sp.]